MVSTLRGRWSLVICTAVLGVAVIAAPASAQTGGVKGKVVDAVGKPVDGAKVTIAQADGASNQKYELKSKKGDFLQIGISPGEYKITAEKDGLTQTIPFHVSLDVKEVTLTLKPGGASAGEMSKADAAKNAARVTAVKAKFSEGAALSTEGKYDEAIAKFTEVLVDVPKCAECYTNIGSAYAGKAAHEADADSKKKAYDSAEEAFKKAIEQDPSAASAYNDLATVYNSQKKFKEAAEMSAEAVKRAGAVGGSGAGADTLYNQGVISWNANDFTKAQEAFSAAVAANPNHGESHFMLGRVNLNLGKLAEAAKEFETYVKIAPTGPNAKEAQSNFEMLKQYIK